MDKETGKPVQRDGADATAETTFTPASESGMATVTFEFDGTKLAGHDTVAFESLSKDSKEVATHTDINNEGQTVELVSPESMQVGEEAHGLPKTSDETSPLPLACLARAAACGAGALALAKRHRTRMTADDNNKKVVKPDDR
jgi:hypothetical protein